MPDLEARAQEILALIEGEAPRVTSAPALADLRAKLFGRKAGLLTAAMKELRSLAGDDRKRAGQRLNQIKREAETRLEELAASLERRPTAAADVDLTLPGRAAPRGTRHPLTLVREELEEIFLEMGYSIADGPEVDDEFHCFEALNIPADHPARDMQDTLYVDDRWVLRPHTSSVQIRTMENERPPIRVIATGRCYRRDTPDLTHSPMFHQIEGLVIDRDITMGNLKGTLEHLSRRLFTPETRIRLRPSFFPFTEPSAELDISCFACDGGGCSLCKGSGFIEMGGCGMVDPNVLSALDIDPEGWSGFAFGLGIERIAMLKHGIDNIRLFFENDGRFLRQFPALTPTAPTC